MLERTPFHSPIKHLVFSIAALMGGFSITFLGYIIGGFILLPGWSLAKLFFEDTGGESLLAPIVIINTAFYAVVVYLILSLTIRSGKRQEPVR
jgi:phage shock protein PspC (stress-responsive transcriptional regulator)